MGRGNSHCRHPRLCWFLYSAQHATSLTPQHSVSGAQASGDPDIRRLAVGTSGRHKSDGEEGRVGGGSRKMLCVRAARSRTVQPLPTNRRLGLLFCAIGVFPPI